jgi:CcmD family protein
MIPYYISIKYMLAGYTAIFIIIAAYLISLITRWRKLRHESQILEDLENQK